MARGLLRAALMLAALPCLAIEARAAPDWWSAMRALRSDAGSCRDLLDNEPPHANIEPRRDTLRYLRALLRSDSATCPGGPVRAATVARQLLGDPEAPDAEAALLELVWEAAEHGRGMARDPVLADRLGRLLWLYEDMSPPRWPEAGRQRWLEQPSTIILLERRAAQRPRALRTQIVVERLAALKLRRDLPSYDPQGAFTLLDEDWLLIGDERRIAFSRLVTSGTHLPPQFDRARRGLILFGSMGNQATPALRAELLRVGQLAASRARTPAQRAEALRIMFAAAIDNHPEEVAARDRLLRRIGRAPTVALAPGDAERIAAGMHRQFAIRLPYRSDEEPSALAPVRLRGLIAPDGRLALAQLVGSSGSPRRDRGILAAWAVEHRLADLSATARGRFVWVDLPPVDPELPLPR
jgi:hypothetical protein